MTWRFSSARKHPLVNLFRITISLRKMSQIFLTFYIFYFSLLINSTFSISFRFSKINDSCITRHIHYLIDVIRGGGGKGRRGGRKGGGLVILVLFIVFVFFCELIHIYLVRLSPRNSTWTRKTGLENNINHLLRKSMLGRKKKHQHKKPKRW